jgi:hypothetical protein
VRHTGEMQEVGTWGSHYENSSKIWDLLIISMEQQLVVYPRTISPSLARAGKRVGGASLWLSIPSNTKTNLHFKSTVVSGARPFSSLPSSTTNCARLSQRPTALVHSTAFATAPTVCSSKCLPVIHSALLTIANSKVSSFGSSPKSPLGSVGAGLEDNASRRAFVMALLPVASRPYKTKFLCDAARI